MGTVRTSGSARMLAAGLAMLLAVALMGCGSSSSKASTSSSLPTSTTTSASAEVPALASSTTIVTPPPAPPAPSTIPRSLQAPCTALTSALSIGDLRLRNSGNWTAERQRIITDAASNVELFSIAANGVPAEIARALEVLKGYSRWLGDTVASAASFDTANNAVNAYPDAAAAANATAVVDGWKRANC